MAQTRTTTRTSEARIGSGARVRGRVHGDGDLLVEGQIEGDVALRGDLTVTDGATVAGKTIEAHAVSIAGGLEADVTASGPIRLEASARVRGDLRGAAVTIADGAHFSGQVDCAFELPPELGGGPRVEPRGRASGRR